jgi:hypothetical protein
MFEFFSHNPYLLFILGYVIYRMLSGKKNPQGAAGARPGAQRPQQPPGVEERQSFQERLDAALRQAEAARGEERTLITRTPPEDLREPFQEPQTRNSGGDDPFAFHSLMEQPPPQRTDYDQQAAAFGFRPAVEEPVEKEFHLTGFTGFQPVHGLSGTLRPAGESESVPKEQPATLDLMQDPSELYRAVILSEVLGKPKALRGGRRM